MLPHHYGTVQIPIVRKGKLPYGSVTEQLDKISNILTGYEKNVEEAEQTQAQYQMLANVALVVFLLGGSYIGYKFYQELKK